MSLRRRLFFLLSFFFLCWKSTLNILNVSIGLTILLWILLVLCGAYIFLGIKFCIWAILLSLFIWRLGVAIRLHASRLFLNWRLLFFLLLILAAPTKWSHTFTLVSFRFFAICALLFVKLFFSRGILLVNLLIWTKTNCSGLEFFSCTTLIVICRFNPVGFLYFIVFAHKI